MLPPESMVIYPSALNWYVPSLSLGPKRIEYVVTRGWSRRYTYFRFLPDLRLEVIIPRGREVDIEKELAGRSAWLQREHDRLSRTQPVLGPGRVMYCGEFLRFVVSYEHSERLVPDVDLGVVFVPTKDHKVIRELVRRWFLSESSTYAVRKAAELAPRVGAKPTRVDVREIGKWGYCTKGGRLTFSWQLIALPERLREYVVLHELTHLHEFNHSAAFKRRLQAVCPDFLDREKELDLVAPYDRLAPP